MQTTTAQTTPRHPAPDDDELLVNYNDAVMYGRDWKLLVTNGWLNDACIHYHLQRLQHRYGQSNNQFVLLDPAVVSFLVHQADADDRREFRAQHKLQDNSDMHILIPINDSMVTRADWWNMAGTHWTLLHYRQQQQHARIRPLWRHYDSMATTCTSRNSQAAQTVARILCWNNDADDTAIIESIAVPQQTNGYDCGIHVLATIENILQQGTTDDAIISHVDCSALRREIADDVLAQAAIFLPAQKKTTT